VILFATAAEFREWLEANHDTADELIVGFYRRASGKPSMTWSEAVDEALCFGWIDGVRHGRDHETYTNRFTPRRPGSHWSAVNVAKAEKLIAEGRMHPAGLKAFERRRPERTAQASYERTDAPELTPEQDGQFKQHPEAWEFFSDQPPWYRRTALHWVASAKKPETRERRLQRLIEASANGTRAF
jgi:uncharacterized protein YdeI (YjbR/CyaY-like superfamily)